jgi:ribonuclease HI
LLEEHLVRPQISTGTFSVQHAILFFMTSTIPFKTIVFTDGASRGNPGPGGWGVIIMEGNKVTELGGREDQTTNNRMELMAAIQAVKFLNNSRIQSTFSKITIHIDSGYVVKGIREWIHGWEKNNWITKTKEPVLNSDLWKELRTETSGRSIFWNLIPGHAGIPGNERCDAIATSFADNKPVTLFSGLTDDYKVSLEIPENLPAKKPSKAKNGAPAYSYVSKVDGVFYADKTWKECEARVKGKKGAKFKKVFSQSEEDSLRASW